MTVAPRGQGLTISDIPHEAGAGLNRAEVREARQRESFCERGGEPICPVRPDGEKELVIFAVLQGVLARRLAIGLRQRLRGR
jgi:hypothetical protein